LADLLEGRVTPENADPRIMHWAELYIFQGAEEILSLPSRDERRIALSKVPETIRPYVEREAKRLWELRKK
jgi:hypothetical protein